MRLGWLLVALLLAGGVYLYLNPEYRSRFVTSNARIDQPGIQVAQRQG